MTKIQYWSKVLLELDTDTGKIRIMQGFHQPAKDTGFKKPKKVVKVIEAKEEEVQYL